LAEHAHAVGVIAHQAARESKVAIRIHCRNLVARGQRHDVLDISKNKGTEDERLGTTLD
jgi:predicted ATPase